jgi:hypothetical protein
MALGEVEQRVWSTLGGMGTRGIGRWVAESIRCSSASDHHLTVGATELAVEIARWTLNRGDMWTVIGDRTLRLV